MTAPSRTRGWPLLLGTSTALLVWSNVVVDTLPPAAATRAAANAAAAALLVLAARGCGLGWTELGVSRSGWRAGALWGAGALLVVAAAYGSLLAVPELRILLLARQPDAMTAGELAVRALVVIPIGTVLTEEIAFRGVLLAIAHRVLPPYAALLLTSTVFGLWHVDSAQVPDGASPVVAAASVAGTVVVTGLGGVLFGWLRQRSGSLLAPLGAHLGINSLGLLAVHAAAGRS